MSSLRRIAASRANGARSRGPVTPEGKERSAQNAVRHGLLARTVVLDDEDPESFETLLANLVARLQPADAVELSHIEDMAAAQWRQRRIWAIEVQIMNDAAAAASSAAGPVSRITAAFRTLAAGPELTLIHRYETRQNRLYQQALQNFLTLRDETSPNEPNPISEQSEPAPDPVEPAEPVPAAASEPVDPAPSAPTPVPSRPAAECSAPDPTPESSAKPPMEFLRAVQLLQSRGLLPT